MCLCLLLQDVLNWLLTPSAYEENMKIVKMVKIVNDHAYAKQQAKSMPDPKTMPIDEVIDKIYSLTNGLQQFWGNSAGWASIEAAQLLSKSRLDWQVSLSVCLKIWNQKSVTQEEDGRLILAWANLGSLVEGSMKLFLSVWYSDYVQDVEAVKKKGKTQDPDSVQLEPIRHFFAKRVWGKDKEMDNWVQRVQHHRNAIHAYQDRDLGTLDEFQDDVRYYLNFLRYINFRLPYPDDMYRPQEA
jgi:hypothetical protein